MGKHGIDFSDVTTVGLDLVKHIFQVHAIDASGPRDFRGRGQALQAFGVFPSSAALSGRDGSLRFGASLSARTHQTRA